MSFGDCYTIIDWINSRDLYLMASRGEGLPENLVISYRERAKVAADKVREAMKDIEELERAFELPSRNGNDSYKIKG